MKFKLKDIGFLLKQTFSKWNAKDPFRESAVIAYYSIFSIPALLVIVISIASLFFGREVISGYIYGQINSTMGATTAQEVQQMVLKTATQSNSILASIIGFVVLLLGATGVFAQLQKSLNIIWEVEADPKKENFWKTVRIRLFSFGLVVSMGFLLLVSLVATSILTALGDRLASIWPEGIMALLYILNFLISFAVISTLFALIFKVLPDAKIKLSSVWIGSVITALLFVIGKFGLAIYFGKTDQVSVYGSAGSVILILLWVSYSCGIVFFGAEFTKVFADHYAPAHAKPNEIAVKKEDRKV
jgi:membrane protein